MSDSGFNNSVFIFYIDISDYMLQVIRSVYRHLSEFQWNSEICFHCIEIQNNYTQVLPKTYAVKCEDACQVHRQYLSKTDILIIIKWLL